MMTFRYEQINHVLVEIQGVLRAFLARTDLDVIPELADNIEPSLRRVLETGEP
jgi:hypothetical protein